MKKSAGIILFFIDGIGIGESNPQINPFYAANCDSICNLLNNSRLFKLDANLGVKGLPQSATGQTAIFTGKNGSMAVGRHINGQPTPTLVDIINKGNLFTELAGKGISVTNSNVYRNEYLKLMNDPSNKRYKPSVTSVMTMSAGLPFRNVEEYDAGLGIYHDITGNVLVEHGYAAYTISPSEAAVRLFNVSRQFGFTLFEHFMSDVIGHNKDLVKSIEEVQLLDSFIGYLVQLLDVQKDLLVIVSDHGNLEDASVKVHTKNKVPFILYGLKDIVDVSVNEYTESHGQISDLTHIMPLLLSIASKTFNV